MPSSVLKSYSWSLKMDVSDEGPSKYFGSSRNEPSVSRSSGRHQNLHLRNTQAAREKHQTELTSSDDVILSKPSVNCLSLSSLYSGLIPSYYTALSFLPLRNWTRVVDATFRTDHFSWSDSSSLVDIAAVSTSKKAHSFPLCLQSTTFSCGELHGVTSCSALRRYSWYIPPLCLLSRFPSLAGPLL